MKIEYVARKVDLSDDARQVAEKKLAKIKKYFNDILDVRLELEQERHLFVADLLVRGKDFDIKSTSQNKDLTTAIQDAVDKLEIQARRAKTKLKHHKSRTGRGEVPVEGPEAEPEPAPAGEARIVERSTITVKPMSVEEAVMQLEKSRSDFLVFRNSSSDSINVLYRRTGHDLGLITPES
ncbi:MAG: ribosomal subunit interface protein [Holophagae bacterium]|nr:MAG: ribosomal subunit interface protein [Holophagae bacterium]